MVNLQSENQELAETCAKMQQIMQSQQEESHKESKLKSKLRKITSNKNKLSKNLKSKDRELRQLKNDLAAIKQISKGDTTAVRVLNDKINKLNKEVKESAKIAEDLRKDNQAKDDTIESLRQQISQLQNNPSQVYNQQNDYAQNDAKDDSDDYKDDSYEDPQDSNIIDENPVQDAEFAKEEEAKGELKPIISESVVDPLFEKLKLLLQRKGIECNNMAKLFPEEITILKLEHKLKTMGLKDSEERLALSRYIIEPRTAKMVEFNENRKISETNAENILKTKIEQYKIYKNEKELQERVKMQVGRYISTLKDALECEDLDGTGYIPANALKS